MSSGPRTSRYRFLAVIALELFTLNFLWEMAQARFYSSMKGLPFWPATWLCTRAAAADVALLALFFVIAALGTLGILAFVAVASSVRGDRVAG